MTSDSAERTGEDMVISQEDPHYKRSPGVRPNRGYEPEVMPRQHKKEKRPVMPTNTPADPRELTRYRALEKLEICEGQNWCPQQEKHAHPRLFTYPAG